MPLEEVATSRRSVEPPHDHVGVDLRLTILLCDISHQRENLDLLADGDLTVILRLPVEVTQRCLLKRANGREPRGA